MRSAGNAMLKCFFFPLLFKKIQSTQVWTCLQIERSNTATSVKSTECMQQGIHTYLYIKVWLNRNPHRKCGKWFTKCLTKAVCLENRNFFRNQGLHFEGRVVFHPPKVFSMDLSGGCSTAVMKNSQQSSVCSVYFTVWLHVRVASVVL